MSDRLRGILLCINHLFGRRVFRVGNFNVSVTGAKTPNRGSRHPSSEECDARLYDKL